MRGAERPVKVRWTRPFLGVLGPVTIDSARSIFIDIADNVHDIGDIDKILGSTDNMPLAICLMAHLADADGCPNVLARWEEKKIELISEGYNKESNLALSIAISLASPRLSSQAQDLLSLLSILPDGLSDAELFQCQLPIENIQACKTNLLQTSLAHIDNNKRLKVLVPIREYIQKVHYPRAYLVQPLFNYFQELLEFYDKYYGTMFGSQTIAQISSNHANMSYLLRQNLSNDKPDLAKTMYCACHLLHFSTHAGFVPISFLTQILDLLPVLKSHGLSLFVISYLLGPGRSYPGLDPSVLIAQGSQHIEYVNDAESKCNLIQYYLSHVTDSFTGFFHLNAGNCYLGTDLSAAENFYNIAQSYALGTENLKQQIRTTSAFAQLKWYVGDFSAGQQLAWDAQRLSKMVGNLYFEAVALRTEAMCCFELGNYKASLGGCKRARKLLALCGLSGGRQDHVIMNTEAEVHKLKSEYTDALHLHVQIMQQIEQDYLTHGFAIYNIAEINVIINKPRHIIQQGIDMARILFQKCEYKRGLILCDTTLANLHLREGNIMMAYDLFQGQIKTPWQYDSEIFTNRMESLGNPNWWNDLDKTFPQTVIYLALVMKSKAKLHIFKALQFLGDIFLAWNNEHTAISLLTVALNGFTWMDVHQSRAECMLRLGEIAQRNGDIVEAAELWTTAKQLFEQSSQTKQIEIINARLASNKNKIEKEHEKNLGCHRADNIKPDIGGM